MSQHVRQQRWIYNVDHGILLNYAPQLECVHNILGRDVRNDMRNEMFQLGDQFRDRLGAIQEFGILIDLCHGLLRKGRPRCIRSHVNWPSILQKDNAYAPHCPLAKNQPQMQR